MQQESFGVGAQVIVRDASPSDPSPWPSSPSGVIVGAAGSVIQGVWGPLGGPQSWLVEFDEPEMRSDGEGPFERAQVNERFLQLAPPVDSEARVL
jgi:hypothetical protein